MRGGILDLILLSCLRHWASYAIPSDLSFPYDLIGPKDLKLHFIEGMLIICDF